MKFKIEEGTIDIAKLKRSLEEEFKERYKISNRSTSVLVLAKTKIIGATVTIRKDKLYVVGSFPDLWVGMFFTIIVILLGVVVPLLLYYILLHKKMEACAKEVGAFIKEVYAEKIFEKTEMFLSK